LVTDDFSGGGFLFATYAIGSFPFSALMLFQYFWSFVFAFFCV